jgi:ABC-type phosphate transport system substrate-binding protein
LVPFVTSAAFAATGSIGYALLYPIAVPAVCFVIALFIMPVVVNIEGVKSAELILDGVTAARIFLGEIRSWNDAAIRKLNPNLKLPAQAIIVVCRSDGSGTTFAFTDYLTKVRTGGRRSAR